MMEKWIGLMEPFVTTNSDQTYSINFEEFLNSIQTTNPEVVSYFRGNGSTNDDVKVVEQLNLGIPIVNKMILKNESDETIAGWACWNYWWGRRCCYWGTTAQQVIQLLSDGSWIPVWGNVAGGYANAANHIFIQYGGFCMNQNWAAPFIWLTHP